jgi:polyhydroxybutyrate depolymerase
MQRLLGVVIVALLGGLAACAPAPPPVQRPPRPVETRSPGCGVADPAPPELHPLPGRRALLAVPADYDPFTAHPLVLSLHPFVLPPEVWDLYSGMSAAGTARGYVVVSPLGSDPGPRWAVPGGLNTGIDDLGFLDALLDDVGNRLCIDRTRVFAVGFSAGAAMAQGLSCVLPDRLRAIAASGGANLTDLCPNSDPVSGLIMHGTADPFARITGSDVLFATPLGVPTATVVATNSARAGCDPNPVTSMLTPSVEVDRYLGCTSGKVIEYRRMLGAGHSWAGHSAFFDGILGGTDVSFDATTAALDFFDAAP